MKVLRVGVDGTDKELNAGEYGDAPAGQEFLITGHESLGRVVEVGPAVPGRIAVGALVGATVRRPGSSAYDLIGQQDFTTDDVYFERGISHRHGYLAEYFVEDHEYLIVLPEVLSQVGVLLEPLSVVEKAIHQADEIQRRLKIWRPQRAAVLGAGTIGLLATLVLRLRGIEVTCLSERKAPYANSELIASIGASYLSTTQSSVAQAAQAVGPFDLIIEATGFSPLAFEAAQALGKNGVLILVSVTGGQRTATIESDALNQSFVLGNKVMVGSVNASPADFRRGVDDLIKAQAHYPGWLESLLTTPIAGLEAFREMLEHLSSNGDAIKVYVDLIPEAPRD